MVEVLQCKDLDDMKETWGEVASQYKIRDGYISQLHETLQAVEVDRSKQVSPTRVTIA